MTREEKINALSRQDKIARLREYDEQRGMAAATQAADRGGGVEATPTDRYRSAIEGVEGGISYGLADPLKVPGDYLADVVQGEEFGTSTESRRAREKETQEKAPGEHMVGEVGGALLAPGAAVGKGAVVVAKKARDILGNLSTLAKVLIDLKLTGGTRTAAKYGAKLADKLGKVAKEAEKKGLPDKIKKEVAEGIKDPTSIRNKDIFRTKATKKDSIPSTPVDKSSIRKKDIFKTRPRPTKGMKSYKGD